MSFLKSHKIISSIIVIAIAVGGYLWYQKSNTKAATVSYVTEAAQKQTVVVAVTGTGQVAVSNQVDVKPQGAGQVTSVQVSEGQQVKAGDVIATLDSQTSVNQINQAKVSLMQAQAAYNKLVAGPTSTDLAPSQLSIKSAQEGIDKAKSDLQLTQTQQQQAVDKAYISLLNADLTAVSSDALSTAVLTVSGNYNLKTEGQYIITTYQTGNGLYYNVSGLGSQTGPVNRGTLQPLGNGLYITFGTTGNISNSTSWTIDVPNKKSNNYLSNVSAYTTAQQNQTQALAQGQAAITNAENQLEQAQAALNTKTQSVTQPDILSAQAQIDSAKVQLTTAQEAYSNTIVRAPFSGLIAKLLVKKGDQGSSGTSMATLITNQQIAQISLNEVDVSKIKLGDKSTLTFDAVDGLEITGAVASIDALGTVTQGVVTYTVKIGLDTQDDRIKSGMSVAANIVTNVVTDVLTVPNAAVKTTGGNATVQLLDANGKPQSKNVEVGVSNDTVTEIKSGLSEGDKVVTQTISSATATTSTNARTTTGIPGLGGGTGVRVNGGGGFGGRGN